ncbi:MAG: hypothetical protein QOJ79_1911 [Actinomycetota bacterium]|jgi:hypothetical protein|nr:hypothetical protein [Actinomycetota bacterium]
MVGRAKYGLSLITVAVLAPLAAATLGQATGASSKRPNAIIAVLKAHGKINGTIYAVQPTSNPKARVRVSLHHLTPATSYVVAASTTSCSHTATNSSRLFRLAIKTSATGDDAFKATVTPLSKQVTRAKSLRIYQQGTDGKYHQTTCYAPGSAVVMVTDDD